jgi:hypothetical protein
MIESTVNLRVSVQRRLDSFSLRDNPIKDCRLERFRIVASRACGSLANL